MSSELSDPEAVLEQAFPKGHLELVGEELETRLPPSNRTEVHRGEIVRKIAEAYAMRADRPTTLE